MTSAMLPHVSDDLNSELTLVILLPSSCHYCDPYILQSIRKYNLYCTSTDVTNFLIKSSNMTLFGGSRLAICHIGRMRRWNVRRFNIVIENVVSTALVLDGKPIPITEIGWPSRERGGLDILYTTLWLHRQIGEPTISSDSRGKIC